MSNSETNEGPGAGGQQFLTTRWTLIRRAQVSDSPSAMDALSHLCQIYWYPLYAYVRRLGHSTEDAQDLTQSFFARILEKQLLDRADPERGRFRAFLLSSLKHFLHNEWEKGKAQKRGGAFFFHSWDELEADNRYVHEPFSNLSPDKLYERRWAMAILDRAREILRQEYVADGELPVFEALQGAVTSPQELESYKEVAARLKLTEDAIKMRVHRLKKRFKQILREVVADTVENDQDLADELRHLFTVWG